MSLLSEIDSFHKSNRPISIPHASMKSIVARHKHQEARRIAAEERVTEQQDRALPPPERPEKVPPAEPVDMHAIDRSAPTFVQPPPTLVDSYDAYASRCKEKEKTTKCYGKKMLSCLAAGLMIGALGMHLGPGSRGVASVTYREASDEATGASAGKGFYAEASTMPMATGSVRPANGPDGKEKNGGEDSGYDEPERTVRTREPMDEGSRSLGKTRRLLKVDCESFPMRSVAKTVKAKNVQWLYAETVQYYGLGGNAENCCINDEQIICTDGKGIVYGEYVAKESVYSVMGRTSHCTDSEISNALSAEDTYPDDSINSDLLAGYVVDGLYVYDEFRLNCSYSGRLPEISGDELNGYRLEKSNLPAVEPDNNEGCEQFNVRALPFRGDYLPEQAGFIKWLHKGTETYFGLHRKCMECYVTPEQVICTDGKTMSFGEYLGDNDTYSLATRTSYCLQGYLDFNGDTKRVYIDDPIWSDVMEGRVDSETYIREEFGINCRVINFSHQRKKKRKKNFIGLPCPPGAVLKGSSSYRQAISDVQNNGIDHIHSHSLHTMTVSSCSAGYNAYGAQQFGRHFGHGSGELLGRIMYCNNSFAGTQNPLLRLASTSGYSSARGRIKTAFVGSLGCYMTTDTQMTAYGRQCDGYAPAEFFPDTYTSGLQPSDGFWSGC